MAVAPFVVAVVALAALAASQPPPYNYGFYLPTDDVIANIRSGDAATSYNGLAHMASGALRVCRATVFKCNVTSPLDRRYLLRLSQNEKPVGRRLLLASPREEGREELEEEIESMRGAMAKMGGEVEALSRKVAQLQSGEGNGTLREDIIAINGSLSRQQAAQQDVMALLAHAAFVKSQQCGVIETIAAATYGVVEQCGPLSKFLNASSIPSVCDFYRRGCIKYLLARMKAELLVKMIDIRRAMRKNFFAAANASSLASDPDEEADFEAFLPVGKADEYVGSLRRVLNASEHLAASDADDIVELFLCVKQSVYDFLGQLCKCYDPATSTSPVCMCAPGRYFNAPTSTCELCAAGSFQPTLSFASSCSLCSPGRFASAAASSSCAQCPSGMFSSGSSATRCEKCPAGTKSAAGSSSCSACSSQEVLLNGECSKCQAGQRVDDPAKPVEQRICQNCAENTFAATSGAVACEACPLGTVSGNASSKCTPCAAGKHRSEGMKACETCRAGKVSLVGATSCSACPKGSYQSSDGASECLKCSPGSYAATEASSVCKTCDAGCWCDGVGLVEPKKCPAGTLSKSEGATSSSTCRQCPAGLFCPEGCAHPTSCTKGHFCPPGSGAPQKCPAGTVQTKINSISLSNCSKCHAGYYCPQGSDTPTTCPEGHFCPEGSGAPQRCPAGTFQNFRSKTSPSDCRNCSAGTYSPASGVASSSSCAPCPQGSVCPLGSRDWTCPPGTFRSEQSPPSCQSCPARSFCPGGRAAPARCPAGTSSGAGAARCS